MKNNIENLINKAVAMDSFNLNEDIAIGLQFVKICLTKRRSIRLR
jgi:hypothetical protein